MNRKTPQGTLPELSKAEYDILRILWKKGRQSVREAHEQLEASTHWALTTTRTVMDRMAQKGLLEKENFHGIFLYTPLISRPAGLARLVKFFAERVLETDTNSVVAMFGRTNAITPEEIEELQDLLDSEEKQTNPLQST